MESGNEKNSSKVEHFSIESQAIEESEDTNEFMQKEHQQPMQMHRTEMMAVRRSHRALKAPTMYGWDDVVAFALACGENEYGNFCEALQNKDKTKWLEAMMEEMESLAENEKLVLVNLPKGKKAVVCKWIYHHKEAVIKKEGDRFEARLVVKGYTQKKGVDYDQIFSPVVGHTSIRRLIFLVANHDIEFELLDVKTTFLHGDLEVTSI